MTDGRSRPQPPRGSRGRRTQFVRDGRTDPLQQVPARPAGDRAASFDERSGRRLLTAVGELAQLAGWVASDAGEYVAAQGLYLGGVSAASAAGDRGLAGQLLSSLSYQVANVGDPADAVLLAR